MSDAETPSDIALAMAHDLVSRDFRLMENWDDGEASAIIGPTMCNDESIVEPPAARQPGIAGARATYDWLRSAYSELRWTVHRVVAEGDWAVAQTTMSGRQTGPFMTFAPDGEVGQVFPATGRTFAASQSTGSASLTDNSSSTAPIVMIWARRCSW